MWTTGESWQVKIDSPWLLDAATPTTRHECGRPRRAPTDTTRRLSYRSLKQRRNGRQAHAPRDHPPHTHPCCLTPPEIVLFTPRQASSGPPLSAAVSEVSKRRRPAFGGAAAAAAKQAMPPAAADKSVGRYARLSLVDAEGNELEKIMVRVDMC